MGVKISKRCSPHSFGSFSTKRFVNVPCDDRHKSCFFGILKFQFFFKFEI